MDKIIITLSPADKKRIEITDFPELDSENKLVNKGIGILRRYASGTLRYLSLQRVLAHLTAYQVEVHGGENLAESKVRLQLGNWMRRKRNRRLAYVILELLLMPFTAFIALLPGPNVVFYGLFVLFYFHAKAFLSLSRIKVDELNISLVRN
jgi:hypothetical protein